MYITHTKNFTIFKKENIGLIEVYGSCSTSIKIKRQMNLLAEYILEGKDIRENEAIEKHAHWAYGFLPTMMTL